MKKLLNIIIFGLVALTSSGVEYNFLQCEGSLTPYPARERTASYPDSLVAVFINHVGRHGARYPASSTHCMDLKKLLDKAERLGTITPLGRELQSQNEEVIRLSRGKWGALDSVGMAEQAGIASRMIAGYPSAFPKNGCVSALSSYSPRCMMSMFSFVHALDERDTDLTITTSTGRIHSGLMRPFDLNKSYLLFRKKNIWAPPYDKYFATTAPTSPIKRIVGEGYPFKDEKEARDKSLLEYYVLAGFSAMGLSNQMADYFTIQEANALWSCFNLRQYLQRTSTTLSSVPAEIAVPLVKDIVETTDRYVNGEDTVTTVRLRFGHAETVMPLVSLLRLPGCYYHTTNYTTVADHWRDFDVVPMAANVQFILFKARKSGKYYMRIELNETPLYLFGDSSVSIYTWEKVREYLLEHSGN